MEPGVVDRHIFVEAPAAAVWAVLTDAQLMAAWMSDYPLEIQSDWVVGGKLMFRGDLHGIVFENKGTVLEVAPDKKLRYTYFSSLSKLPDRSQHYSVISFTLTRDGQGTLLTLEQRNFVTITNYKHFDFYWNATLMLIKQVAERERITSEPNI